MAHHPVQLDGARVVVTGAGSGIGRATALALSARGSQVVAVDRHGESAEKTAADCGGFAYQVDVSDRVGVAELALRIADERGVPDVLVNNAGVGMSGRFLDMDLDDWDWIIGINLMGAVNFCRAFGPAMLARRRGHVVNVASGLAYLPRATEPGYCTTKAAILSFSQCLRADWHRSGVGVSAICPGVINTSIVTTNTRYRGERDREETRRAVRKAFARGHPPEKVADAIVDAVLRNRSVVPVGVEAQVGWLLRGLLPAPLRDLVSRAEPRSL
ncbi:MAG: SDR family NAD(P)-dependent oxidoreductase [Acidimicrobiales bacterium]